PVGPFSSSTNAPKCVIPVTFPCSLLPTSIDIKKMLLLKNFNQWTCRLPEVKKYFHLRAYRGMVINFIYIYIIVLIMKACQYAGSSSGSVQMISPSSEKK